MLAWIWCQGVEVLPGFCKILSQEPDYARYLLERVLSPSTPGGGGVLLCSLEASRVTGKTSEERLQAPGSQNAVLHLMPAQTSREPQPWPRRQAQSKAVQTCDWKSQLQSVQTGVWKAPFPQPSTFSKFRPWIQWQGGCAPKIIEVKSSVSWKGWRLGDKINLFRF